MSLVASVPLLGSLDQKGPAGASWQVAVCTLQTWDAAQTPGLVTQLAEPEGLQLAAQSSIRQADVRICCLLTICTEV
jgi:hypothetical protein